MTIEQGPLNELLPEIYPVIAAHLPLYLTPSTLLALGLTNHHISEIALPLVYSRLILKNERDAILVLQKLVDNPPLGRIIRELHIMSDLSPRTRRKTPPSDMIRRVDDVISKGYLPFMHTLGLHLMSGWYTDPNQNHNIEGFGQLRNEFWVQLKEKCPRLRGLILKGFIDDSRDEGPGLLRVPDITNLTINFKGSNSDKLIRHISSLAPSLHTLNLKPRYSDYYASLIFECDLHCLRSLSLGSFQVETAQAMTFFERHPSIEYLDVASNFTDEKNYWFSSNLPEKFLPNLRHLRAHWDDVRRLAPILDQLFSLSINKSVNAQIPYLLRFVLPKGLPNLKSLDIGQEPSNDSGNETIEGSHWFESEDGTFKEAKTERTMFDSFMHSIVHAVPNLEELGFHGTLGRLMNFVSIADDLNGFLRLKHLYYEELCSTFGGVSEEEKRSFASKARDLAEAVPGLISITNVFTKYLPHLTAKIHRGENGELVGVEVGKGYGLKIGYDDEAFPWVPYDSDKL